MDTLVIRSPKLLPMANKDKPMIESLMCNILPIIQNEKKKKKKKKVGKNNMLVFIILL